MRYSNLQAYSKSGAPPDPRLEETKGGTKKGYNMKRVFYFISFTMLTLTSLRIDVDIFSDTIEPKKSSFWRKQEKKFFKKMLFCVRRDTNHQQHTDDLINF